MTLDEQVREHLQQGRCSDAIRLIRLILETEPLGEISRSGYMTLLECLIKDSKRS